MKLVHNDETRTAEYTHANGNVYTLRCKDPYGFWSVSAVNTSPRVPLLMQGNFTTLDKGVEAINKAVTLFELKDKQPIIVEYSSDLNSVKTKKAK